MPGSNRLQDDLLNKFSDKGPRLFLLRHGQIEGHATRRFIGRTDIPLDPAGQDQARAWQAPFAAIQFGQVFTSGLGRCRQTADLACPDSTAVVDCRLNEIDLGDWDGHTFSRIKTRNPDLFELRGRDIFRFRPPGGESFKDLLHRVSPFFHERITASPTLIVTHAGVIRTMLCAWAEDRMENILTYKTTYGQLFVLA